MIGEIDLNVSFPLQCGRYDNTSILQRLVEQVTFKQHLQGWRINSLGREVVGGHSRQREQKDTGLKVQMVNLGPFSNIMWLKYRVGGSGREEEEEKQERNQEVRLKSVMIKSLAKLFSFLLQTRHGEMPPDFCYMSTMLCF